MYFHFFKEDVDRILRRENWDGEQFYLLNYSTGEKRLTLLYRSL